MDALVRDFLTSDADARDEKHPQPQPQNLGRTTFGVSSSKRRSASGDFRSRSKESCNSNEHLQTVDILKSDAGSLEKLLFPTKEELFHDADWSMGFLSDKQPDLAANAGPGSTLVGQVDPLATIDQQPTMKSVKLDGKGAACSSGLELQAKDMDKVEYLLKDLNGNGSSDTNTNGASSYSEAEGDGTGRARSDSNPMITSGSRRRAARRIRNVKKGLPKSGSFDSDIGLHDDTVVASRDATEASSDVKPAVLRLRLPAGKGDTSLSKVPPADHFQTVGIGSVDMRSLRPLSRELSKTKSSGTKHHLRVPTNDAWKKTQGFHRYDFVDQTQRALRRPHKITFGGLLGDPEGCEELSTVDLIQRVIANERKRLTMKIQSRAFDNDFKAVNAENLILRGPKVKASESSPPRLRVPGRNDVLEFIFPRDTELQDDDTLLERNMETLGRTLPFKWCMTIIVAIWVGFQGSGISLAIREIIRWKVATIFKLSASTGHWSAFFFMLAYAMPACFVASCMVTYFAPHAAGGGIPEIKAFLNGISMPQAFKFRTWFCRACALILVASSQMYIGTVGPFAHLGALAACIFARIARCAGTQFQEMLNGHRNRCELIAQGAAMGIAASFGAPVGGLLFSVEEVSTYWSKRLTWRVFVGTLIAAVVGKIVKSGFTQINPAGFIDFPDKGAKFKPWELFFFAIVGVGTGIMGGLFCMCVKRTIALRKRFFKPASPTPFTRRMRLLEVQVIVVWSAAISLWPAVIGGCRDDAPPPTPKPTPARLPGGTASSRLLLEENLTLSYPVYYGDPSGGVASIALEQQRRRTSSGGSRWYYIDIGALFGIATRDVVKTRLVSDADGYLQAGRRLEGNEVEQLFLGGGVCPPNQYSDIGYLLLNPREKAINALFTKTMARGAYLSIGALVAAYIIVWLTTLMTFGSAIPCGLFIPNILHGAILGRIVGEILRNCNLDVHPGVYALMGGAGGLSGFSRMTVSVALIFLEFSNNIYMLLPLMLAIYASKTVADCFCPSINYLILFANPDVHLLEDSLSEDHTLVLGNLNVHDVCSVEMIVVQEFHTLRQIARLLLTSAYSGYPVVDGGGKLVALASRTRLVAILELEQHSDSVNSNDEISVLRAAEKAPEIILWNTPAARAYHIFAKGGLTHAMVINKSFILLGILTRTDLARICKEDFSGVEQIRNMIVRKDAVIAAGEALQQDDNQEADVFADGTEPRTITIDVRAQESLKEEVVSVDINTDEGSPCPLLANEH